MLTLILATLLTHPEAQAAAVDSWCARQPLQVAERRPECNPVLAERNAEVSRFLRECDWDRAEALAAAVTPFAVADSA
jgi:hypothetical protein